MLARRPVARSPTSTHNLQRQKKKISVTQSRRLVLSDTDRTIGWGAKVCHSSRHRTGQARHLVNQVNQWRLYSHIDHYLENALHRICHTSGLSNYYLS